MSRRLTVALALLPAIFATVNAQTFPSTTPPRVVKRALPSYTKEAREAGIEGNVTLSLTVEPDGTPSHITVVKGLGKGLDEKAIECVKQWRFAPASNGGTPIAEKVSIELNFRLASPQ